jgi:hypothetical protein
MIVKIKGGDDRRRADHSRSSVHRAPAREERDEYRRIR